jgi:hypothetical protein
MAILTGTNCTTDRLGTGMESCQTIEGLPSGLILTPKGWSLSKTSGTFDKTYVQAQIQAGLFIPMVGCFDAVSETPDPTTEESQSGLMSVVRQGKPTFTFTFKNGLAGHKARYSYNSYNEYDALIVYESGVIKCAESVDGSNIKGMTIGMLNTGGYSENNGTNSASSVLKFQVTNPQEYNQYVTLLSGLNFNPNTEINGITDVKLTGTADATTNTLFVNAVWLHNEQFNFSFFTSSNFKITVEGTEQPIDGLSYNTTTKQYEILVDYNFGAGDEIVAELFDGDEGLPCVKVGDKFYRGATPIMIAS